MIEVGQRPAGRHFGLRFRLQLYLLILHLAVAWILLYLFLTAEGFENLGLVVFLAEIGFAVSLIVGWRLVSALFVPLRLVETGAELIEEGDFGSTFRPVGQPELDRLIEIYNRMIGDLRQERTRVLEHRAFLELLVGASPSGIVICDLDGRVAETNPSADRLLGRGAARSPAEDEAFDLASLVHPWGRVLPALSAGESRVVSLDDGRRVRCRAAELRDRGFPRRFFLLDELTDDLRRSEKAAYDKLIRLMSHEVNNSVGAVTSLLAALAYYRDQIGNADREDFEHAVEVASDRLDRLRAFVEDFAEVVRLPEPRKAPVDLGALMADLGTLLRPFFAEQGVELAGSSVWQGDGPMIEADREQLEQVLLNIAKNAAEATGEEGRVVYRLDRNPAGRVRLVIEDDGPGIDAEVAAELFTPFFTTKAEGSGLGLTLAKEVLERHGFEFSLRSMEGGGSRFLVVF